MNEPSPLPPGAPCWIEAIMPDPPAGAEFYRQLLGWEFDPPSRPGSPYRLARLGGRRVAGIGQGPAAVWSTSLRVTDRDQALTAVQAAGGVVLLGALDVGDDRAAIIADPAGLGFGIREQAAAEVRGEPGSWAMSALHTPDPDGASAFYAAAFGWQIEPLAGARAPLLVARVPGTSLGAPGLPEDAVAVIAQAPVGGPVPGHWAVNVAVEDVDRTLAVAGELGGWTLVEPIDGLGLRSAVLSDPQGAALAISAPA